MKVRGGFLLIACLVFGTAGAQTTTLEYQGELMTGMSQSLVSGAMAPAPDELPLVSLPFAGVIDGSITISGQPDTPSLTLVSYNFSLLGKDGADIPLYAAPAPLVSGFGPPNSFCGDGDGCIDLTLLDNSVVGATLDLSNSTYNASSSQFVIGPSGDSVLYLAQLPPGGGCEDASATGSATGYTYTGPTIPDCTIVASNSDPGRWTVEKAPEFAGEGAPAALTLLLGGLAVLSSRRKVAPVMRR